MNRKQSSFEQAIFKVKQHKHWRRQEALAVLQEWQRSGLSLEAFSRLHGLTPRRISDWKKRIDRQPESPTTGLGFVELQIVEQQQSTQQPTEQPLAVHPSAQATPPPLEVILRGERIVRVQPGFDALTLARVVEVLEVMPC